MIKTAILIVPTAILMGCASPEDIANQQCHHYLDNLDYHSFNACYDRAYAAAEERQAQVSQALIQQGAAMQAASQASRPTVTTTNCNAVGGTAFCNSVTH